MKFLDIVKPRKGSEIKDLLSQVTFYFSLFSVLLFSVFYYLQNNKVALIFLYLMFVFWGVNKVIAFVQGKEIRLTFSVKISENAPRIFRILALVFSSSVALYGLIEFFSVVI